LEDVVPLLKMASDLSIPLELCVLKFHLIVELELYQLLALRLDVEERHLPPLQYFHLAKLALAGTSFNTTLKKVLALNDLRNEFSHELADERLQPAYAIFVHKADMFWPESDVLGKPKEFAEMREVAVRWSAYSCFTDVFGVLSNVVVSHPDYPGDVETARQVMAHIEQTVEATRRQQASLRSVFEKRRE
jgi:hypothetical protein